MWIMFNQIAPNEGQMWAVGYLDNQSRNITNLTWYYTEDEARLSHHRLTN